MSGYRPDNAAIRAKEPDYDKGQRETALGTSKVFARGKRSQLSTPQQTIAGRSGRPPHSMPIRFTKWDYLAFPFLAAMLIGVTYGPRPRLEHCRNVTEPRRIDVLRSASLM